MLTASYCPPAVTEPEVVDVPPPAIVAPSVVIVNAVPSAKIVTWSPVAKSVAVETVIVAAFVNCRYLLASAVTTV